MKKIILSLFLSLFIVGQGFCYDYSNEFKRGFYDEFSRTMFETLESDMVSRGYSRELTKDFISKLKERFNREELEDDTWACVSKIPPEQVTKEAQACFMDWIIKFVNSNSDLVYELTKESASGF